MDQSSKRGLAKDLFILLFVVAGAAFVLGSCAPAFWSPKGILLWGAVLFFGSIVRIFEGRIE